MSTLAPLAAPEEDPWLAPFVGGEIAWWLLRDGDASGTPAALADLVARVDAPPDLAWIALIAGDADARRYVLDAAGVTRERSTAGADMHTVVGPLDARAAAAVVDAARTVPVDELLLLVAVAGAGARRTAAAPGRSTPLVAGVHAVVLSRAGQPWAVIGCDGGLRPPPAPGVHLVVAAERVPAREGGLGAARGRREGVSRRALTVMSVLVGACLAAVGAGTVLHRGGGSPAGTAPARTPAVSTPAASGIALATEPAPRYAPSLASNPLQHDLVLFGGSDPAGTTWVWDRQGWTAAGQSASPSDRLGAALAYDPALQKVLLFGGRETGGAVVNDTWAWDGTTWTQLLPAGPGPPGDEFHGMTWDEARQQMILLTARPDAASGRSPALTWTWRDHRWEQLSVSIEPPSAPGTAMAFDPVTRTVLLVLGGLSPGVSPSTWSWNGETWRQLHPAQQPDLGFPSFLALDPDANQLVLVGPTAASSQVIETWTWDGRHWTKRLTSPTPTGMVGMAVDPASGALIAIGHDPGVASLRQAWAWTGRTWAHLLTHSSGPPALTAPHPAARQFGSTGYDQRDRRLVLFGGRSDPRNGGDSSTLTDTWTFDGSTWVNATPATHPPSGGPMAFDVTTGEVLMVADAGGTVLTTPTRSVTWGWDGSSWRALSPATEITSGTTPVAMAADPATGTVVAVAVCCYAPSGNLSSPASLATWVWSGTAWSLRHPRTELSGGTEVRMAYDPASRRVIAVVSSGDIGPVATWAWNGATWNQLHPASEAIFDPLSAVMATDGSTRTVVLLERAFQVPVSFDASGGTQVWEGATWAHHVDLLPSDVDTAYGNAALYTDADLGRLVVVSSTSHDYSRMWMWTGTSWLQLEVA